MTTIREKVFETNSSSTHSVCITPLKTEPEINDLKDHIILGIGEYGWGFEEYNDALTKLDYLAVEIDAEEDDRWPLLINTMAKYYPNCTFELADYKRKGYVDHQSYGDVWSEIGRDEKTLIDYLFNKNSILIIDNDNH